MPIRENSGEKILEMTIILAAVLAVGSKGDFRADEEEMRYPDHGRNAGRSHISEIHISKEDLHLESSVVMLRVNDTGCSNGYFSNYSDIVDGEGDGNRSAGCNNSSLLPHAPGFGPGTMVRAVTLSIIALFSLIGNVATLGSICRTRRQNSSTVYLLIAQLAIADLLVTFFCVLAEAIWTVTVQWLAGNAMCKIIKYMQMFALYLSTFVLVVIGFDRFCAVRFPMRRANAKRHVRRCIVFVWTFSGLLSIPQLVIFRVQKGPFLEEFYQCVTYGFYTAQWQEQLYTTISLILMFLLPLLILITTYICTFYTISNSGKENMFSERIKTAIDDARRKIIHKAKVKSLMITVVIVLAFVICWTPYYCMMIIFIFLEPNEQLSEELQSAIFFFGSSTAMINPLIYGAFHLRTRTSRKSTTLNNSSAASSRLENSIMMLTFRKSRSNNRRSNDEPPLSNGTCNGQTSRFRQNLLE